MSERIILVSGATGRQGARVARQLLRAGWRVRALTRNPAGQEARALGGLGAELAVGDLRRPETLAAPLRGVHGVFAVTEFWEHGYAGEVAQGRALVDAAAAAKVSH